MQTRMQQTQRCRESNIRRSRIVSFTVPSILVVGLVLSAVSPSMAQEIQWLRQFGSLNPEGLFGVASTPEGVFVAGQIERGSLGEEASSGSADGFLCRLASNGEDVWVRQFGTSSYEWVHGLDDHNSRLYVVGGTLGEFPGESQSGGSDAFLAAFDTEGNAIWTRQFGSSSDDVASGVSVDERGIFVSGWTGGSLPGNASLGSMDAFLARFDFDGNPVWLVQFGTAGFDQAQDVSTDNGLVYVAGRVGMALPGESHLGSADAFVRAYDADGNESWTDQFGTTGSDEGHSLSIFGGMVYVAGRVTGALPGLIHGGNSDAFVRVYDGAGLESWSRQFGWIGADEGYGVAAGANGIFLAGRTSLQLEGETGFGGGDAFVVKLDHAGTESWTHEFGSSSRDDAMALAVGSGGTYACGVTWGALPENESAGGKDAYLMQLEAPAELPAPEPEPEALTAWLDVLPGSCNNPLNVKWADNLDRGRRDNPNQGGVLPVALVGSTNFAVEDVDASSLLLEGVAPERYSYEDVSTPPAAGLTECPCDSSGADGLVDLTMKFRRQDLFYAIPEHVDGERISLTLTGTLLDGTPFEARDCVQILAKDEAPALGPAVPNPFNPVTSISYVLPRDMEVRITVYDVRGRLLEELVDGTQPAGRHTISWDADGLASGTYFYRLQSGVDVETRKMILLK